MHKRKLLKTKTSLKIKHSAATSRRRRAVIVGAALAVLGGPASWLVVSAQSDATSQQATKAQSATATADHAASPQPDKTTATGSGAAKDLKKDEQAKKVATDAAAKVAQANTKAPVKTPAPVAAVPPKPTAAPVALPSGSHDNIITTIFWVGEAADASNANITNTVSAWDESWQEHYGGVDDPNSRNGYLPAAFTPHENPFYFALPYNDFDDNGNRKTSAGSCANAALASSDASWCKNTWIRISHGGKTAYAQWQDVGPLQEDDTAYVFGTGRPQNTWGAKAGLDVSPAVRDYLGLQDVDAVSWAFVKAGDVPAGVWKQIVTTSLGT